MISPFLSSLIFIELWILLKSFTESASKLLQLLRLHLWRLFLHFLFHFIQNTWPHSQIAFVLEFSWSRASLSLQPGQKNFLLWSSRLSMTGRALLSVAGRELLFMPFPGLNSNKFLSHSPLISCIQTGHQGVRDLLIWDLLKVLIHLPQ